MDGGTLSTNAHARASQGPRDPQAAICISEREGMEWVVSGEHRACGPFSKIEGAVGDGDGESDDVRRDIGGGTVDTMNPLQSRYCRSRSLATHFSRFESHQGSDGTELQTVMVTVWGAGRVQHALCTVTLKPDILTNSVVYPLVHREGCLSVRMKAVPPLRWATMPRILMVEIGAIQSETRTSKRH